MFSKRGNREDGLALLVVLWVIAILTVIVGQFCYSMRAETNSTRNFRDGSIAYYQARAGVEMAYVHLLAMSGDKQSVIDDEEPLLPWRINVENSPVVLGEGAFQVRLENSSGKVNLNFAAPSLLELLFADTGLDETDLQIIVDSIQDWRDSDNYHRLNGAEDDYYRFLPEPYFSRNGPFQSIEELLLVRGMTEDLFDHVKNRVTIYPSEHEQPAAGKKKRKRQKQDMVLEQKKININAASADVLAMFPFMDQSAIDSIAEFRKDTDFSNTAEVREVVGAEIYALLGKYINIDNSSCYTIHSTGFVTGSPTRKTIEVVVVVDGEKQELNVLQVN